ncbi:MAG TPA: peptidoglycan DD-metalloendopeptidase family protein [Acidimicrobiia bacterium]|nr:peptidoglycan DD-metalloendopeptidase family protein [Acidimicrobiia bacterium]
MVRHSARRWVILISTFALLALVPIGASAQTQSDVDAAERNKRAAEARQSQAYRDYVDVTARLDEAVERYELIHAEHEDLLYRISRMEAAVERYTAEAAQLEETARTIVVDAYMSGQRGLIGTVFTATSIQDLVTSQALLDRAADRELTSMDNLQAVSRQADRSSADLDVKRAEVAANENEAAGVVEEIAELQDQQRRILAAADDALRDAIDTHSRAIREKKIEDDRRKKQAAAQSSSRPGAAGGAPAASTPGFICPVEGGAAFIDSWGFPRSGGRSHKGVDMFNARNTRLLAVVDGRITFSSNSLGGLSTHLYADNGVVYYYTHLEGHPSDLSSGQRVAKGTVVGYLGNSGNARYTSPHLHFEIRPNGKAVNPYPTVRSAC